MSNNIFNNYPRPALSATGTSLTALALTTAGSASSNATSFTISNTTRAELFFVDIQAADVTVTFDGSAPNTGVNGHHLYAGTNYTWATATLEAAMFIATSATSSFIYASPFQV